MRQCHFKNSRSLMLYSTFGKPFAPKKNLNITSDIKLSPNNKELFIESKRKAICYKLKKQINLADEYNNFEGKTDFLLKNKSPTITSNSRSTIPALNSINLPCCNFKIYIKTKKAN